MIVWELQIDSWKVWQMCFVGLYIFGQYVFRLPFMKVTTKAMCAGVDSFMFRTAAARAVTDGGDNVGLNVVVWETLVRGRGRWKRCDARVDR